MHEGISLSRDIATSSFGDMESSEENSGEFTLGYELLAISYNGILKTFYTSLTDETRRKKLCLRAYASS